MMITGLAPKIAKFNHSHMATGSIEMKFATDSMPWMSFEQMRNSTGSKINPYTFKCEIFSFDMLLWELVFKKIPYEKWDIMKIKEHVLAVEKYSTEKEIAPALLPEKTIDLEDDEIQQIIFLEKGIAAHRRNEYQKAWDCFVAHAALGNTTAKYWKGRYLWEEFVVEKDRKKALGLFKEAADDGIGDAQFYYSFSLVSNPLVKFDRKIFLEYLTKSTHNNNPIVQFNLGEVYSHGKHGIGKDKELGCPQ
ncbi:hypothetical protein Glove_132g135 [Diversispora epigaea]|uniref:Protein kinase domain-containing protein n=1 Tax=Diversispora epigaea TaxID=1348612 RepID=A0A397J224_9GLOM|nr:hypothetical protein Glove_132g135 [Diversispora epigaea]